MSINDVHGQYIAYSPLGRGEGNITTTLPRDTVIGLLYAGAIYSVLHYFYGGEMS